MFFLINAIIIFQRVNNNDILQLRIYLIECLGQMYFRHISVTYP